ncbi:MAG: hypothetical protein JWL87_66 [Candidatus Adlerbacteria bacterium]|nr:hypothetical protein [Candidatus Adlerbacteria bacterium]
MDTEIEELKELVRRNTLLSQDTNKVVHAMRRNQRWHTFVAVIWWVLIFSVSAYTYYAYVQPYVHQVLGLYDSAQGFEQQARSFFGQYFGTSTSR